MELALMIRLAAFNTLPQSEAERLLFDCCSSVRWASCVAAGRPYGGIEDICSAADRALAILDEEDVDEAMSGHPRIGARLDGAHTGSSSAEQAGVARSSVATMTALANANAQYEARFGQVYLVCADGRGGEELLAVLAERLRNVPARERAIARNELGKINRLRLRRLFGSDVEALR
jgi:2-oxo-4-hydroxy-4-carboxy-5-ureidoimidazoline decarboxylase